MRTTFLLLAILSGAVFAVAQDVPVATPGPDAKLTARRPVATTGQPIELELSVDFREAATVPATLIGGHDLEVFVDGQPAPAIRQSVEGSVSIAAGTRLIRRLEIPAAQAFPDVDFSRDRSITFQWAGLPNARVAVRVLPDRHGLDLATLDYENTKVRLITSKGDIVLRFFPDLAPKHVESFVKLSRDGFYDGTRFHRVLRGFMIQGGDPNTKEGSTGMPGTGGPGYTLEAEFNKQPHVRGTLSMARGPDPNSAGSQFFIMHGDERKLDGQYTAFGIVEAGMDTVDAIADSPVEPTSRGEPSRPAEPIWLYAAVVEPAFKTN